MGALAILMQLSLSSNNLHLMIGLSNFTKMHVDISAMRRMMSITSLRQVNNAAHSASVDDKAIRYCNLLYQTIGIPI